MAAFDRVLLGHDHGPAISKTNIPGPKSMMIRVGVAIKLQAGLLQRAKKSLRMANSGHGMHTLRAKRL